MDESAKEISAAVPREPHLCLCESQLGSQLCALRQGQVLSPLEHLVELLELQGGVDGAWLPHFLALGCHSHFTPLGLLCHCKGSGC